MTIEDYFELDKRWDQLKIEGKENTPEEDVILSEMDDCWYSLTEEEREEIRKVY